MRPFLEDCIRFWDPQFKKGILWEESGKKQQIKGQEHHLCKERLRELCLFSIEKGRLRLDLVTVYEYLKCISHVDGVDCFH